MMVVGVGDELSAMGAEVLYVSHVTPIFTSALDLSDLPHYDI